MRSQPPMLLHLGSGGDRVPAIMNVPDGATKEPAPAALLIHGLGSTKEQMAGSIGRSLVRRGIVTLAVDLPLHGARASEGTRASMNPLVVVEQWRLAIREAHDAILYLAERPEVDATRIGIAGYSLGAYLSLVVAAADPVIRAIVLAAGGDVPSDIPFAQFVRTIFDPRRIVRGIAGRPLLMVNGRFDRRIRPEAAEALFAAAHEPKELQWYDGGHWPPPRVIDDASEWLSRQLEARPVAAQRTPRTKAHRPA
jgi:uncharacterized protein